MRRHACAVFHRSLWSRSLGWAATAVTDVARVVVPVECPGCGLPDVRWCEGCEAPWWEPPLRCESSAPRLVRSGGTVPAWSITTLESTAHRMIGAWKDAHRRDLDEFFGAAIARAVMSIAGSLPERLTVVPAPARPASTRHRGVDLPFGLAQAAARAAHKVGIDARVVAALHLSHGESRGANARVRWSGSGLALRTRGTVPHGAGVLIVDDVLTTGATVAGCVRELASPVTPVIGALVLASATAPAATLTATSSHNVGAVPKPRLG